MRSASQCRLIAAISTEVDLVEAVIAAEFKDDPGYRALLTINGIGPVFASVFPSLSAWGDAPLGA